MSQPERKPKARLRQLPEERQLAIFAQLQKSSVAEVRASLKKDGIDVGSTALSEFWQYWVVESQLRKAEVQRLEVIARVQAYAPEIPLEQVEAYADAVFLTAATAEGDLVGYTKVRRITEASKRTALETRRIQILEQKAAQLDKVGEVIAQKLQPEEQARRIREILK